MFVHADCESLRASVIYLDKLFLPVTNCLNLDGACSEFMPHKKCEVGTEYALDITVGNDANLVSCATFCGSMSLCVHRSCRLLFLQLPLYAVHSIFCIWPLPTVLLSLNVLIQNDRSWPCMVVFKNTVTCPVIIFLPSSESANHSEKIFCDLQSVLSSPCNSNVPLLL